MPEAATATKRYPWWVWVLVAIGVLNFVNIPVLVVLAYLGSWPFN